MSVKRNTELILGELTSNAKYLDDAQLDAFVEAIRGAGHIFTAGAGRSGVMVRAFTNRLMHLGCSVSVAGEITSPHSQAGDLLIIASGSGETGSLVALANKAVKNGVKVALLTMDEASSIAKVADVTVRLPGVSPKLTHRGMDITSVQPMGSAFEQMTLLALDAVVLELMEKTGQTSDEMFARHADLE